MLENPLGADETDLNLLGMVHSLEVACSNAFDMSNKLRPGYRQAQKRPFQDFGLEVDLTHLQDLDDEAEFTGNNSFSHYFHWLPMPSMVLENVFEAHGHIDTVHAAKCRELMGHQDLRALIRKSVLRSWRPHRRRTVGHDRSYQAVPTKDDVEFATHPTNPFLMSSTECEAYQVAHTTNSERSHEDLSEGDKDTLQMLQDDPNVFSDYLVFEGVLRQQPHEVGRHQVWNQRAAGLLGDHSASSLILKAEDSDTERSTMGLETHQRFAQVIKGVHQGVIPEPQPQTPPKAKEPTRDTSKSSWTDLANKRESRRDSGIRDPKKKMSGKLRHPILLIRPKKQDQDDSDDCGETSRSEHFDTGASREAFEAHPTELSLGAIAQRVDSRAAAPCSDTSAPRELTTSSTHSNNGTQHSVATGATSRTVTERDPLLSSPGYGSGGLTD